MCVPISPHIVRSMKMNGRLWFAQRQIIIWITSALLFLVSKLNRHKDRLLAAELLRMHEDYEP